MKSNSAMLLNVVFEVGYCNFALEAFHKGRPQSEGLSSTDIFRTRGSTDADVRTFWCKNSDFSKFMVYPHGLWDYDYGLWTRERSQFFAILYGRPLRTAPYGTFKYHMTVF